MWMSASEPGFARPEQALWQTLGMASIPHGAEILTVEGALSYFHQWTAGDRVTARHWIDRTGVTDFYVPPSGGYVAGHGGDNRSVYREMPVNGLLMHVGFLHARPNFADTAGDERIELSNYRPASAASRPRLMTRLEDHSPLCPRCRIATQRLGDHCDICGHDFAAARAAVIERFHAAKRRASERLHRTDKNGGTASDA